MSDKQDGYWIIGHADGIGERPKPTQPLKSPQEKEKARHAPRPELEIQPDLEELTEILNQLDRLREPD